MFTMLKNLLPRLADNQPKGFAFLSVAVLQTQLETAQAQLARQIQLRQDADQARNTAIAQTDKLSRELLAQHHELAVLRTQLLDPGALERVTDELTASHLNNAALEMELAASKETISELQREAANNERERVRLQNALARTQSANTASSAAPIAEPQTADPAEELEPAPAAIAMAPTKNARPTAAKPRRTSSAKGDAATTRTRKRGDTTPDRTATAEPGLAVTH